MDYSQKFNINTHWQLSLLIVVYCPLTFISFLSLYSYPIYLSSSYFYYFILVLSYLFIHFHLFLASSYSSIYFYYFSPILFSLLSSPILSIHFPTEEKERAPTRNVPPKKSLAVLKREGTLQLLIIHSILFLLLCSFMRNFLQSVLSSFYLFIDSFIYLLIYQYFFSQNNLH